MEQRRIPTMRKKMPPITESADALRQRRRQEKDPKKRQRLQALYLAASGRAHHRQEIADLLGVHRHSVAAWFDADATGGLAHMLPYQDPHGVAGYQQLRVWLAEEHQVTLAYSSVHALVRYKLRAKPKRPRPSHAKKAPKS